MILVDEVVANNDIRLPKPPFNAEEMNTISEAKNNNTKLYPAILQKSLSLYQNFVQFLRYFVRIKYFAWGQNIKIVVPIHAYNLELVRSPQFPTVTILKNDFCFALSQINAL